MATGVQSTWKPAQAWLRWNHHPGRFVLGFWTMRREQDLQGVVALRRLRRLGREENSSVMSKRCNLYRLVWIAEDVLSLLQRAGNCYWVVWLRYVAVPGTVFREPAVIEREKVIFFFRKKGRGYTRQARLGGTGVACQAIHSGEGCEGFCSMGHRSVMPQTGRVSRRQHPPASTLP